MTDAEWPKDPDRPGGDEDTGVPPPSTWAGRARKEEERASKEEELEHEGADEEEPADPEQLEADEQEDPPDEFAFDDDEEDDEPGEGSDPEAEAKPTPEPVEGPDPNKADTSDPPVATGVSGVTVEADTLALSDIEAAREAAHAGLTARAKKSSFSHEVTTSSHKAQPRPEKPPVPAASAEDSEDEDGVGDPPRRRIGLRFVAAAFVIVSSMAAATAVSFLLFLSDIAEGLNDSGLASARAQLDDVDGGAPQTILILGSDKRESTKGDPGRSDTAMLIRVDPQKEFLSLMSLPRDLTVPIPGYGPNKLNAAYTLGEQENEGGGEELAIRTIKEYLDIPINHVVNVDFSGFYEAVNAIGCVYIDIDRRYFNANEGVFEGSEDFYAEIDIDAGYQKLCGYKALQYVRYRHNDNDLVRGARQQDFIREARQRIPPTKLLPVFGEGDELIDIFTENTSSDINNVSTIIAMMKSFLIVKDAPVRQVSFGQLADDGGVVASPEQIDTAVEQFLGNDLDDAPANEPAEPKPEGNGDGKEKPDPKPEGPEAPQLVDFSGPAADQAKAFARFMDEKDADLPIFHPTQLVETTNTSLSDESRAAVLVGPNSKDLYYMYKYVIPFQEDFGVSYYGVSGTNWDDPPILKNPSGYQTIDGREYMLFYEQDRLRLIGWQTSKGSYWVNNTLTHALTEDQMLAVATSSRELDQ